MKLFTSISSILIVVSVINYFFGPPQLVDFTISNTESAALYKQTQVAKTTDTHLTGVTDETCTAMVTVKSGDWNDPTVWTCNRIPTGSDSIVIKHLINVPPNYTAFAKYVSYNGGKLAFIDSGSKLIFSKSENLVVLNPKTIIVSVDSIKPSLISVDSTKIVFKNNGKGVDKISVGSILVSDIIDQSQTGFLQKVTSVSIVDGQKICTTTEATLTEAIINANVNFKKLFTDRDIASVNFNGVHSSTNGSSSSPSFNNAYAQTINGVSVMGKITLEPYFVFNLDIKESKLNTFETGVGLVETTEIKGEVTSESGATSGEVTLATFELAPFTIPVGEFPLVFRNFLVFTMGVDGNISSKIVASASSTNNLYLGLEYANNNWINTSKAENVAQKKEVSFKEKAKLTIWLQGRTDFRLYGLKSNSGSLAAKVNVIGEVQKTQCNKIQTLDWGILLFAKINITILTKKLLDYTGNLFSDQFPLYKKTTHPFVAFTDCPGKISDTEYTGGGLVKDTITSCQTDVLKRGVCYGESHQPTLKDAHTDDGTGLGAFISTMLNLVKSKTYYIRAYAIAETDTIYGDERAFVAGDDIVRNKAGQSDSVAVSIGDIAYGGMVFYVKDNGKHGMVMVLPNTLSRYSTDKVGWWPTVTPYGPGDKNLPMKTEIGSGASNTLMLLSPTETKPYVAGVCHDLLYSCYHDWYLPSRDELLEIYKNLDKLPGIDKTKSYYSSSLYTESNGCFLFNRVIDFKTGKELRGASGSGQGALFRCDPVFVRLEGATNFIPVRSF